MFGGVGDGMNIFSDMWKLDLTNPNDLVWEEIPLTGDVPSDFYSYSILPAVHEGEPLIYISKQAFVNQLAYVYTADGAYTNVDDLPASDDLQGSGYALVVSPTQIFHYKVYNEVKEARLIT